MNFNDLIAQQQAMANQAIQHQQGFLIFAIVFQLAGIALMGWVIYMFYARLRDIADELRRMRINYDFELERSNKSSSPSPSHASSENPFNRDSRYMPKN